MSYWMNRADEFIKLSKKFCPVGHDMSIHERITLTKHREQIEAERRRSFEEQREYLAREWMGQGRRKLTFTVGEPRQKRSWWARIWGIITGEE
jgi:hypothetical protein